MIIMILMFYVSDSFIDSAITNKYNNGPSIEKELEPWDGEGGQSVSSLDSLETKTPVSSATTAPVGIISSSGL